MEQKQENPEPEPDLRLEELEARLEMGAAPTPHVTPALEFSCLSLC